MISVSPNPLKATRNWVDRPWPKAISRRIDSVPQNRAKVMSEAFFRRFRYSLQKKRGRVAFMLLPQGLDGIGGSRGPRRNDPGDDADGQKDQDRGDDDQRIEDGDADEVGETALRKRFHRLQGPGRESEADQSAQQHDDQRLAEELPEDRPPAGADGQLGPDLAGPLVDHDPHDRSDPDAPDEKSERADDSQENGEGQEKRG